MSLFNTNGGNVYATNNIPYANQAPQTQRWNLPHYETPLLNGRNDANNFLIGPNSSIILPDAREDIVWWIRTDNYGNKSVIPWDISLHKEVTPVDLNELQTRLANVEEWINAKQNKSNAKRNTNAAATTTQSIATE